MSRLLVRAVEEEERIQISFNYALPNKSRIFNFDRPKSEELSKALAKISNTVASRAAKKRKKKPVNSEDDASPVPDDEIAICLFENGEQIENDVANKDAWKEGRVLQIGETEFTIIVNVPSIIKMTLPSDILVGYPVRPYVDAEFTNVEDCEFRWERTPAPPEAMECEDFEEEATKKSKKPKFDMSNCEWTEVHKGKTYSPSEDDQGSLLRVSCVPQDGPKEGTEKTSDPVLVRSGPGKCPFERIHGFTQEVLPKDSIRIVTYNLLADYFTGMSRTREAERPVNTVNMLFPWCPPRCLMLDYRKHLILKEIIGYNGDIVCLQEVDLKLFQADLLPVLNNSGLTGLFKHRSSEIPEGTATFFRKDKFKLLSQHDVDFNEEISTNPVFADLLEKINTNETFKDKLLERKCGIQATLLESIHNQKKLLVLCCHLFYHPKGDNVRLIQTAAIIKHAEHLLSKFNAEDRPAIIWCGDFNAQPFSAAIGLIQDKYIPANHAHWYSGGRPELLENVELYSSLNLQSATGMPPFTNFTASFIGCLDHIFIDKDQFNLTRIVDMPTLEEIREGIALPNPKFPSDHMAQISEVQWKNS